MLVSASGRVVERWTSLNEIKKKKNKAGANGMWWTSNPFHLAGSSVTPIYQMP